MYIPGHLYVMKIWEIKPFFLGWSYVIKMELNIPKETSKQKLFGHRTSHRCHLVLHPLSQLEVACRVWDLDPGRELAE